MKITGVTLDGLNSDHSGTGASKRLRSQGWHSVPVVDFDGTLYAILWHDIPHPGRNTAEVINVSEFNRGDHFRVAVTTADQKKHTQGQAWVLYADEGMSILTVHMPTSDLHEYTNPYTAVLSYRIHPPTRDDVAQVADQLDEELQEYGPRIG
jgi:hypothetical protein